MSSFLRAADMILTLASSQACTPAQTVPEITAVARAGDLARARSMLHTVARDPNATTTTLQSLVPLADGLLEFELVLALWKEVANRARAAADASLAYEAERCRTDFLIGLSRTDEAIAIRRMLLAEAARSGDKLRTHAWQVNLAHALLAADEPGEARTVAEAAYLALRAATDLELRRVCAASVAVLTDALVPLGQVQAAHDIASELLTSVVPGGEASNSLAAHWQSARVASLKARLAADATLESATRRQRAAEARRLLTGPLAAASGPKPETDDGAFDQAELQLNLAGSLARLGDHDQAIGLLEGALATFEARTDTRARTLCRKAANNLASLYFQTGDLERAQVFAERVLASHRAGEPPSTITLQGCASILFSKGLHREGRQLMWEAFIGGQQRLHLLGRGLSLAEQRHSRHALRDYLSTLLSCRFAGESDQRVEDARDLHAVLSFRGALDRQARALARIRALAASDIGVRQDVDTFRDLSARADRLALFPNAPRADVDAVRQERDRVERRLLARLPQAVEDSTLRERLARLPAGTIALTTCRFTRYTATRPGQPTPAGEEQFCAFLATAAGEVRRFDLGAAATVAAAVTAWRRSLQSQAQAPDVRGVGVDAASDPGSLALPTMLRGLLAAIAPTATHLVVCPDAELASVPWEALPLADGSVLLDRLTVTYVDDLVPGMSSDATLIPASLLVAGGIDYGEGSWQPLLGTGPEIERVVQAFVDTHPGSRPSRLTGLDATKAAVMAGLSANRVVHLATHGFVRVEGTETVAGLLLSNGNRDADTGVLRSGEIAGLDLRGCELAVLSACNTGQGDRDAAEAVAGHNRALLLAGARHTITSLWPIADRHAAKFFAAFYRQLWSAGAPVAVAFADSRRELRKAGLPVSVWAGFVLYGRY